MKHMLCESVADRFDYDFMAATLTDNSQEVFRPHSRPHECRSCGCQDLCQFYALFFFPHLGHFVALCRNSAELRRIIIKFLRFSSYLPSSASSGTLVFFRLFTDSRDSAANLDSQKLLQQILADLEQPLGAKHRV